MSEQLAGFPYWEISYDEDGQPTDQSEIDSFLAEVPATALSDLFIFSHGWNNDRQIARTLYTRFYGQMRVVLDTAGVAWSREARIGTAGVFWPSMRWPDESLPVDAPGSTATPQAPTLPAPAARLPDAALVQNLKPVFPDPDHQSALDEMAQLLTQRPKNDQALARFQQLMGQIATEPDAHDAPEDNGEQRGLLEQDHREVFDRFADVAQDDVRPGGAAGMEDVFARLWDGAKEALRVTTYWQMKKRAGVVGKTGLGPLLGRFHAAQPALRIHLIGHSFGARVVSFALAGLPDVDPSPVKSLLLLQGAFSHFAFADTLPQDRTRSGALAGMMRRVDGPLVTTFSSFDTAVGEAYPLASIAARDDAAEAHHDPTYRWGAMGHDGAQAVNATTLPLRRVGEAYAFTSRAFANLDGNRIITKGGPPSGAHSDIIHPEIAWMSLAVAGIAGTP